MSAGTNSAAACAKRGARLHDCLHPVVVGTENILDTQHCCSGYPSWFSAELPALGGAVRVLPARQCASPTLAY